MFQEVSFLVLLMLEKVRSKIQALSLLTILSEKQKEQAHPCATRAQLSKYVSTLILYNFFLVHDLLTIPASSATVECTFSMSSLRKVM